MVNKAHAKVITTLADEAGNGGGGLPEDRASKLQTRSCLEREQWLYCFFKRFRETEATLLGNDCCELVKLLELDEENFASMTELLAVAEERDEEWGGMYKLAVESEIHAVLAKLESQFAKKGGCPASVSFDHGVEVANEIRAKIISFMEDGGISVELKARWKKYEEWCLHLNWLRRFSKKAAHNKLQKMRMCRVIMNLVPVPCVYLTIDDFFVREEST